MNSLDKQLFAFVFLFLVTLNGFAQTEEQQTDHPGKWIGINPEYSAQMLDQNQDLRKVHLFFAQRYERKIREKGVIIGASLLALADYQHSNTDSKFAYLMRHPTAGNQIGKTVSEAVIHSFQLSFTGMVNSWLSAHAEILYNPEQNFGSGTITSLGRNQLQLRKGFILLGSLEKFPVYGAIGKMDAPFGQTGSVSPFTNSTMWHAFGGLGYGAQVSFKKWNVHATLMAVQGGAQFRAMHTPVGDSTNVPSSLNNFTADLNYTVPVSNKVSLLLGGSYLHGSAYCQPFPVTHFVSCNENNPAVTAYGRLTIGEKIVLKGGFATTLEVWPGTYNPEPPLNVFEASKVSSIDAGGKFIFNPGAKFEYAISGEFSNFRAGPEDSPWQRQNQYVLGFLTLVNQSSRLFVEVFRTDGYSPLNFISGSDAMNPFPPGTTHSLKDANSIGVVIGGQITL